MKTIIFSILLVLMAYESQQNIIPQKDRRLTIMKNGIATPLITKIEQKLRIIEEITGKVHNKMKLADRIQLPLVNMQEALSLIQYQLGIDNSTLTREDVLPGRLVPIKKMNQAITEIRAAIIKHQHTIYDKTEIPHAKKPSVQVEQDDDCVLEDETASTTVSHVIFEEIIEFLNARNTKKPMCLIKKKNSYKSFVGATGKFEIAVLFTEVPSENDLFSLMANKSPVKFAELHGNILIMRVDIPYITVETLRECLRDVHNFEEFKKTLFSLGNNTYFKEVYYPRVAMKLQEEIGQLIGFLGIFVVIALLLLFSRNYKFPKIYLEPITVKLEKLEMVLKRLEPLLGAIKLGAYAGDETDEATIYIRKHDKASGLITTKKQYDNELGELNHTEVKIYFPDNKIGKLLYAATLDVPKEEKNTHRIRFVVHNTKQKMCPGSSKFTVKTRVNK